MIINSHKQFIMCYVFALKETKKGLYVHLLNYKKMFKYFNTGSVMLM